MIKIGKIELEDWRFTTTGLPARYSPNFSRDVDACIILYREYINDEKYNWAWKPSFNHKLYVLNKVFANAYGTHIKGTSETAQNIVDNFLRRIDGLASFI